MIKLLIGGSPCTFWSIAQKNNRETEAEGLGWELFKNYLIAKEKFKPDFFLYENNKSAAQAIKNQIKKELKVWDGTLFMQDTGSRYIEINSALVSAQNRQRFYVHNCGEVEQPEDRGILLKDILESGVGQSSTRIPPYGNKDKSRPVEALYSNHAGTGEGSLEKRLCSDNPNKQQVDLIAEPVGTTSDGKACCLSANHANGSGPQIGNYAAHTLTKGCKSMVAEPICLNSKSGRAGIDGLQPSLQDRIYSIEGKHTAVTTAFMPKVAEPVRVGALPRPNGELSESQAFRLYSTEGKSVTINAGGGGAGGKTGLYTILVENIKECEPMRVKEATKKGYVDIEAGDCVDLTQPKSKTRRGRSMKDKSNCVMTSCAYYQYVGTTDRPIYEVKDGLITIKGKQYPIKLVDGYYIIRKLTVTECARLQTMPDDYCRAVSNAQAYKGLGNGWTAEVIIHILNNALKDIPRDEEIVVLSMYDGIGTGRYCLDKMGFTNVKYYAYEIDKYAKEIAMSNYPDIIQMGDAFQLRDPDWTIGY